MKNANLTRKQSVCVHMADEMKIKKVYDYDRVTDTVHFRTIKLRTSCDVVSQLEATNFL